MYEADHTGLYEFLWCDTCTVSLITVFVWGFRYGAVLYCLLVLNQLCLYGKADRMRTELYWFRTSRQYKTASFPLVRPIQ